MTINPTSATTPTTTTSPAVGSALTGSKDEFLKLFMAQLQHQDPLNPQNGSDMVAQLAQFSSVEQATETNQHLSDLVSAQAATSSASLSSLVGRDCSAGAKDFTLDQHGALPPLQITSSGTLNGAAAVVTDDNGKELRRITIPTGVASATLSWDGTDASGSKLAPGSYHIAIDPGKSTGTITSQWHGRVDAVELGTNATQLRMGGLLLAPSDIQTIGISNPPTPPSPSTNVTTQRLTA